MDLSEDNASRLRFEAYIDELVGVIGHADRAVPLHDYCTGLLLPGERKSVEPMAALTAPARTAPKHQSLLHFVANAPWSDDAVLTKVRQMVLPKIEALGPIEASIIDDTGFPKKGKHSVGVARQYCGQLGKQDNCQAVVSLSIANHHASLPIAHQLYLPEAWADDPDRRKQAKIPEDIVFKTKPQIALDQLKTAQAAGIPLGTVLADSGYGYDSQFRDGVTKLGLLYAVGIQSNVLMWKADAILPVQGTDGQKPSRPQLRALQISAKELALSHPAEAWETVTWREDGEAFTSRFARWRVRPVTRAEQPAEEWLVIECPLLPFHWPMASGTFGNIARGRGGADKILAVHLAGRYRFCGAGRSHQAPLADRARLSGTQARAWPGSLRRTRLARIASSHNASRLLRSL